MRQNWSVAFLQNLKFLLPRLASRGGAIQLGSIISHLRALFSGILARRCARAKALIGRRPQKRNCVLLPREATCERRVVCGPKYELDNKRERANRRT